MTDDLIGERCPHRVADMGPFPVLDVVATLSTAESKLFVSVANLSPDQDVTAELRFANAAPRGPVRVDEVNASDWHAANSFANPDLVKVTDDVLERLETTTRFCFLCHSMTAISATL
jgi:alpha-L-arabinofuranosidase